MSKKLPYYQFEVAEYIAGDIMLCSLEAQGLYALIKCLYWQRDCSLNVSQVLKRHSRHDLIDQLKEERCIKIDDEGQITISFLADQWDELTKRKRRLSEAGKKGRNKQLSGGGPGVAQTTPGQLEEIREEDKKEEDNKPTVPEQSPGRGEIKLKKTGKIVNWNKCKAHYLETLNKIRIEFKPNAKGFEKLSSTAEQKLRARLVNDGYTSDQFKHCMEVAFNDKFHAERSYKHLTAEYFVRESTLEKLIYQEVEKGDKGKNNNLKVSLGR